MLVLFESQVLNLKCYAGPLIFRSCCIPNTFFWMGLQIQTLTTWKVIPEQKGYGENTDLRAVVSAEWRDWGRPLLTDGRRSVSHIAQEGQLIGCFSKQDLQQASLETLPGVVLKTSYRHLLHSLHQTGVQRPSCRGLTVQRLLQKVFWKPSSPAATVIVEHETRVKPVSGKEE